MYVEITTAAERVAIENAMCPIMDSLERAILSEGAKA